MTQYLSTQNMMRLNINDTTFIHTKPDVTKHYDTTFIQDKT